MKQREERLILMVQELREIRNEAYAGVEIVGIEPEIAHSMLKLIKNEIQQEVEKRLNEGRNPVFGIESGKLAAKIENRLRKKQEKSQASQASFNIFEREVKERTSPNK